MHGIVSRSNGRAVPARHAPRTLLTLAVLALAVTVTGCSGTTAVATTTAPSSATATATPLPGQSASSDPTGPIGSATAPATASPACAALPVPLAVPGDRLVAVAVTPGVSSDRIAFTFAASPGPAPAGPALPNAVLEVAQPPFVHGGSGQPLAVVGDQFARLTLRNMLIADDAGQPFYTGPAELRPNGAAIRHVVLAEAFEGVESWILGLAAGAGCMALGRSADGLTITIDIGRG